MPNKPHSPCTQPGCPRAAVKAGRCRLHQQAAMRKYDQWRGTPSERGYGPQWQKIRSEFLEAFPNCMKCGQPATEVHHVMPLAEGGSSTWGNLVSLCHSCHSTVTAKTRGWGRAAPAARG